MPKRKIAVVGSENSSLSFTLGLSQINELLQANPDDTFAFAVVGDTPVMNKIASALGEDEDYDVELTTLRDAVTGADFVLIDFNEEDPTGAKAMLLAEKVGAPCFDLSEGLLPLRFDDGEEQTEDEPEAETVAETPQEAPGALDFDALADAVAERVLEALRPLLTPRRPGRPRKVESEVA